MNRYRLLHVTEFKYDGPVSESYNELRLRPRNDETQSCLSFQLRSQPPSRNSAHVDSFGNWVHRLNILAEHRELRIEADSVVLVHPPPPVPTTGFTLQELDMAREELAEEHYDLMTSSVYVPHLQSVLDLVQEAEQESDFTALGFAHAASALVHNRFRYEKGATHVQSSIHDCLSTGAGVCQDFAHLLLAVVRMRGLPARYVSGYLVPAGSAEEVIGGQASHAWAEVFVPGAGWVGLDPTIGGPVGLQHIRVAYGRDYGDVAPVRGVYKGNAGQRLSVDVRVRPAPDEQ